MIFRLGELFSGPGGFAKGALLADIGDPEYKIVHEWSNDSDKDTCETYMNNICPDKPDTVFCCDVKEFLEKEVIGDIDAFAFGFPCNDFSLLGEQKGLNGNYGGLYKYGIQILRDKQPLWFVAENVTGLQSNSSGEAYKQILKDMYESGYRIFPYLYEFEKYGVPQARHRIIIVGIRKDQDLAFRVPSSKPFIRDVSCKKAIEDPPIPYDATNNERTKQSKRVIERLKYIKEGDNAWNSEMPEELRLKETSTSFSQIYRRLERNKPSYTVTGSGGGGTHIYHWEEPRALTNRERARLQTFPDDYVFYGNKESVRKQIGMAVPVRGAQIIFESILKTFAHIEYPSIENEEYIPEIPQE